MRSRLFIALNIPKEVQERIVEIRNEIYNDKNVKWESTDKYHITLKFLGDVEDELKRDIIASLDQITDTSSKVKLSFNRFSLFYKNNVPKILYAGFAYDESLINLHKKIEEEISKFGFPTEKRKYKPHLTICRFKGGEDEEKIKELIQYNFPKKDFLSGSVELIESKLTQQGSIYKIIKRFNLS